MPCRAKYDGDFVGRHEQFNFNNPNEWPNWIKRFERFRKASELKSKKEEEQVNALIYILGEKAEDSLI
ncbi:hypothetical protein LAZ67_19001270 [Cordylochernes scorpioides]|uniref:Uncharacterized protein n=1 Tax=Cordylochernes scorpioides TaxID=51811 RepID=A0ABY6LKD3_9ARAC|nr:hypothetical protein LAZ67_19001270 [Cordylochernes scorpioides]